LFDGSTFISQDTSKFGVEKSIISCHGVVLHCTTKKGLQHLYDKGVLNPRDVHRPIAMVINEEAIRRECQDRTQDFQELCEDIEACKRIYHNCEIFDVKERIEAFVYVALWGVAEMPQTYL
jgi:hypothetical protein